MFTPVAVISNNNARTFNKDKFSGQTSCIQIRDYYAQLGFKISRLDDEFDRVLYKMLSDAKSWIALFSDHLLNSCRGVMKIPSQLLLLLLPPAAQPGEIPGPERSRYPRHLFQRSPLFPKVF